MRTNTDRSICEAIIDDDLCSDIAMTAYLISFYPVQCKERGRLDTLFFKTGVMNQAGRSSSLFDIIAMVRCTAYA